MDTSATHNLYEWITLIAAGGLLGAMGQGARAIVGLKKLKELADDQPPGEKDVFVAGRLLVSLMIGFVAGGFGGLGILKLDGLFSLGALLSVMAIGYAGADAIEGMTGQLAAIGQKPAAAPDAGQAGQAPSPAAPAADSAVGPDGSQG